MQAAAVNGVSAALLWTAQGQLTLAYPTKEVKGMFFAMFWVMFNIGGVVGGFITFGANYNAEEEASAATPTTFLIFIVVMCAGSALVTLLRDPAEVVRPDGSGVVIPPAPSVARELKAMAALFTDARVVLLLPMFLYSNWFFPYHFGIFNAGLFNSRTQGWNTAWYWGAEMVGALVIGKFLDSKRVGSPRRRALLALFLLFIYVNLTWYWALQISQSPFINATTGERSPRLDFNDKEGASPFLLYFSWGFVDLTISSWIYWMLGQLTDDPAELARLVGLYKAIQASGAAVGWGLGDVAPLHQLKINWIMFGVAAAAAAWVAARILPTRNGPSDATKKNGAAWGQQRDQPIAPSDPDGAGAVIGYEDDDGGALLLPPASDNSTCSYGSGSEGS